MRQNLRTPSTQISCLRKPEQLNKKKKENLNIASKKTSKYLEDSTQTDFFPIPSITHAEGMVIEGNVEAFDTMLLPRSPGIQIGLSRVMPLQKEVTRADVKLEEYDGQEAEYDDLNHDLRYDNQHIQDNGPRLKWKLGVVKQLFPGNERCVRTAVVRSSQGVLTRPITRLYPIECP
ncbi:hypothetical protein DPMN_072039 [Dreissena polymorpha]|uniref:DUF5641 domain-containing protein n=1 Tax=Dreissena polymorpha TaxID=45954 RepID=A0A9D3Z5T1_DREPO|nr:hypothetical protein DPMN_072039 [Dreissena polymorpha]